MKKITLISLLVINTLIGFNAFAKTIEVSSQEEYNKAHSRAVDKDVIMWLPGTYRDIYLNISKDGITVQAKILGETIFTGASKANISGDRCVLKGIQFIDGSVKDSDLIYISGDHVRVEELNLARYSCAKYLYIKRSSQYNTVYKCNFEKRLNDINKNIVSIGISDKQPGFHKVQYCSFKNFDGDGGDMGVEPIRIGSSSRAQFDSKTIVEYCYFTNCNGDGELISNKGGKNIIRYNTFENNPLGEVVLRHGSGTYVYGNFFIKGKGGVRIREGANHFIFNNYFTELTNRSITLNSGEIDPIKNVYILHNTFVNTSKLHLGGNKSVLPKKVVLENNLFALPAMTNNIGNATGKEIWTGNMYDGKSGITNQKGLQKVSSPLIENEFGLYELSPKSPAVNRAAKSKTKFPIYNGLDADAKLALDILGNKRPTDSSQKDVGCYELSSGAKVLKPFATSKNTGPSYKTGLNKKPLEVEKLSNEPLVSNKLKEEKSEITKISDSKTEIEKPKEELSEVEKLKKQIRELQAKVNKVENQE